MTTERAFCSSNPSSFIHSSGNPLRSFLLSLVQYQDSIYRLPEDIELLYALYLGRSPSAFESTSPVILGNLLRSHEFWTSLPRSLRRLGYVQKRLFFLHIPRCAGSSFYWTLSFQTCCNTVFLPTDAIAEQILLACSLNMRSVDFFERYFSKGLDITECIRLLLESLPATCPDTIFFFLGHYKADVITASDYIPCYDQVIVPIRNFSEQQRSMRNHPKFCFDSNTLSESLLSYLSPHRFNIFSGISAFLNLKAFSYSYDNISFAVDVLRRSFQSSGANEMSSDPVYVFNVNPTSQTLTLSPALTESLPNSVDALLLNEASHFSQLMANHSRAFEYSHAESNIEIFQSVSLGALLPVLGDYLCPVDQQL